MNGRTGDPYARFADMPDEDIVGLANTENNVLAQEYLLHKYRNFVRGKARSYFLIGAEREDIIQEGMIGLYKAIRDFRQDKQTSFRSFAELCVTRQIITAIKTATRQKHIPLNSYVSLNKPIYEQDSDRTLLDVISSRTKVVNPEEMIIRREEFIEIKNKMIKSIDNALQRVKRKVEKYKEAHMGDSEIQTVCSCILSIESRKRERKKKPQK